MSREGALVLLAGQQQPGAGGGADRGKGRRLDLADRAEAAGEGGGGRQYVGKDRGLVLPAGQQQPGKGRGGLTGGEGSRLGAAYSAAAVWGGMMW